MLILQWLRTREGYDNLVIHQNRKGISMAVTDTHISVHVAPAKGSERTIDLAWWVPKDVAARFGLRNGQRITSEKSEEIRRYKEKQKGGVK